VNVFVLYYMGPNGEGHCVGKFLGVYSSQAKAARAVERLHRLPGYRHDPKGFQVQAVRLDEEFDQSKAGPPRSPVEQPQPPAAARQCEGAAVRSKGGGLENADDRPWERPGALRRDYEPHRGVLLVALGVLSLLCGMAGAYAAALGTADARVRPLCLVSPVLHLVGLWAAAWTRSAVRRDLTMMQRGQMDPSGQCLAGQASGPALGGLILNGCLLPLSVALCLTF
jgi:hypothetical protein